MLNGSGPAVGLRTVMVPGRVEGLGCVEVRVHGPVVDVGGLTVGIPAAVERDLGGSSRHLNVMFGHGLSGFQAAPSVLQLFR